MIAYGINRYVMAIFEDRLKWEKIKDKTPILAAQEEPEFLDSNQPFLIYSFNELQSRDPLEAKREGILAYTVVGITVAQVNDAVSLLTKIFRSDQAPMNITKYLKASDLPEDYMDYIVDYVTISGADYAMSTDSEGGHIAGMVEIRIFYKVTPESFSVE